MSEKRQNYKKVWKEIFPQGCPYLDTCRDLDEVNDKCKTDFYYNCHQYLEWNLIEAGDRKEKEETKLQWSCYESWMKQQKKRN